MNWKIVGLALAVLVLLVGAFAAGGKMLEDYSAVEHQLEVDAALADAEARAQDLLKTELETLEENLMKQIEDLEAEKTSLEVQLNEAPDAATVEELELQIAELEATLATREETKVVVGKLIDDLFLNDTVGFSVDDSDLEQLLDGEIVFDEEDYEVHEEFRTTPGNVLVAISLTEDEEFGANPYMVLANRGAFEYRFVFDDAVKIADISEDEPLEIEFLGQRMEIVEVTADAITVRSGEEHFLREGETVEMSGMTLTLEVVADNKAYVDVDGVGAFVTVGKTEVINGLDVLVKETIATDRYAVATLVLGGDVEYELEDGDEYFDNEEFVFGIELQNAGTELSALTVAYDKVRDEANDKFAALAVGESLVFPNGYLSVTLNEVLNTDYVDFSFRFEEFDDELENGTLVDVKAMLVTTDDKRNIEVDGQSVDSFYVDATGTVYYMDDDEWFAATLSDVELINDDATYTLQFTGASLEIVEPMGGIIALDTDFANEMLGADEADAEATDIVIVGNNAGKREFDVLTLYGTVVPVPEDLADADEFVFHAPSDRVEVTVLVN